MAEWDRLPWYEQRVYQEGLQAERPWIQRAAMLNRAEDSLNLNVGLFADLGDDEEDEADLSDLGINIRRSTVVTPLYQPAQRGG